MRARLATVSQIFTKSQMSLILQVTIKTTNLNTETYIYYNLWHTYAKKKGGRDTTRRKNLLFGHGDMACDSQATDFLDFT